MAAKKTHPRKVVARFLLEAMSNLLPVDTGVDGAVIWVSSGGFVGAKRPSGPRIKVAPGASITTEVLAEAASVTITERPRVVGTLHGQLKKQAIEFVKLNREILLQYWWNEASTRQMLDGLVRIGRHGPAEK